VKRRYIIIFSTILVVIALILFNKSSLKQEKRAEVFSALSELNGFEPHQVADRYFILHFWAKWCAPCAEEMPHLISFANEMTKKFPNLQFLAVSLDESIEISKQILPNAGKDLPNNFHLYLDSSHSVAETIGSFQYPETYFFGPNGKIIEKWVGPQKWNQPEVMEYFSRKIRTDL
jgi:thiol-disulfide isomerase/thioredoxin